MPDDNRQKAILLQRKSPSANIDGELSELCRMMRIMSERDTDGTLPQVLKAMMVEGRDKPVGGSELSRVSGLNRITVIHHLRRLDMLMEFRKDMEKNFAEMDEMARQIDEQFSLFEKEFEERHRKRRLP